MTSGESSCIFFVPLDGRRDRVSTRNLCGNFPPNRNRGLSTWGVTPTRSCGAASYSVRAAAGRTSTSISSGDTTRFGSIAFNMTARSLCRPRSGKTAAAAVIFLCAKACSFGRISAPLIGRGGGMKPDDLFPSKRPLGKDNGGPAGPAGVGAFGAIVGTSLTRSYHGKRHTCSASR
jgi:hypothetical protein